MQVPDRTGELPLQILAVEDVSDEQSGDNASWVNHGLLQTTFGLARTEMVQPAAAQHIYAPLLSSPAVHERWLCSDLLQTRQQPGLHCRYGTDILVGVIEVTEVLESTIGDVPPLAMAAECAYRLLFETLDQTGFPFLLRAWNYMPDINALTHGEERYRHFNRGRQLGFSKSARLQMGAVPAACAIGVRDGPLSISFLAGKSPAVPIENPRQISAYSYPQQYGEKAPTFSRANLTMISGQEYFFLSGTASIAGHQTMHVGNVRRQTEETIINIEAVLDQANRLTRAARPYVPDDLQLRVYVRHAHDVAAIQAVLGKHWDAPSRPPIILQADICRSDLDIEIEGVAWQSVATL